MRKLMIPLMLLTACGTGATPATRASAGPQGVVTTTEATILRLSSPDEQEGQVPPSVAPSSTEAPFVPPRPAQREVSAPVTTILEVTKSIPLESDLLACLKKWESGNGQTSDNLYQFDNATWKSAGGKGSPEDASVEIQDTIAQNWIDKGYLRQAWAAQRGRCFN